LTDDMEKGRLEGEKILLVRGRRRRNRKMEGRSGVGTGPIFIIFDGRDDDWADCRYQRGLSKGKEKKTYGGKRRHK